MHSYHRPHRRRQPHRLSTRRRARGLRRKPTALLRLGLTATAVMAVVTSALVLIAGQPATAQPTDAPGIEITFAQALHNGPVEVIVDGRPLATMLQPGEILTETQSGTEVAIEFRPVTDGSALIVPEPVSATIPLVPGQHNSIIAYADQDGNSLIRAHTLPRADPAREGRCVVVHHALTGPRIDVLLDENVARRGLQPGEASQALYVPGPAVSIGIAPAGTSTVLVGLIDLALPERTCTAVYATGDPGSLEGVVLQVREGGSIEPLTDWNAVLGQAEVTFYNLVTGMPIGVRLGSDIDLGRQLVGRVVGPFAVDGGQLEIELDIVRGDGTPPRTVSVMVPVTGGTITDLVAHRSAGDANDVVVTAFARDPQTLPDETGCVVVRHVGSGPGIDVMVDGERLAGDLLAGRSSGRIPVEPGRVEVVLTPAGAPAALADAIDVRATADTCFVISLFGHSGRSIALWESSYAIGLGPSPEGLTPIRPRSDAASLSRPVAPTPDESTSSDLPAQQSTTTITPPTTVTTIADDQANAPSVTEKAMGATASVAEDSTSGLLATGTDRISQLWFGLAIAGGLLFVGLAVLARRRRTISAR